MHFSVVDDVGCIVDTRNETYQGRKGSREFAHRGLHTVTFRIASVMTRVLLSFSNRASPSTLPVSIARTIHWTSMAATAGTDHLRFRLLCLFDCRSEFFLFDGNLSFLQLQSRVIVS